MDKHLWSKHAKGAAYFIAAVWLALTAAYAGAEYAVSQWPSQDEVPWTVEFLRGLLENLQSEAWQVGFAAWVFKHLLWEGSPDAKQPG